MSLLTLQTTPIDAKTFDLAAHGTAWEASFCPQRGKQRASGDGTLQRGRRSSKNVLQLCWPKKTTEYPLMAAANIVETVSLKECSTG